MSSGLAQWVGNEALCSGLLRHSPCLGQDYQDMLRFSLLRANRTEREQDKCLCVCLHSGISLSISVPNLCVHFPRLHPCVSNLCQYCVSLHTNMYLYMRVHVFATYYVGLSVSTMRVNVVSVKGSDNRIAHSDRQSPLITDNQIRESENKK